jgi:hypothetical protein
MRITEQIMDITPKRFHVFTQDRCANKHLLNFRFVYLETNTNHLSTLTM